MSRFIKDGDILNVGDVITITNKEVLPANWVGKKIKIITKERGNMYSWRFINNDSGNIGNNLWDLSTFIYVKAIKDNAVKRKSISWL